MRRHEDDFSMRLAIGFGMISGDDDTESADETYRGPVEIEDEEEGEEE